MRHECNSEKRGLFLQKKMESYRLQIRFDGYPHCNVVITTWNRAGRNESCTVLLVIEIVTLCFVLLFPTSLKTRSCRVRTIVQTESVGSGQGYFLFHTRHIDFGHVIEPVFTSTISSFNRFKRIAPVGKTRSVSGPVPIPGRALATLVAHKTRSDRATLRAYGTCRSPPQLSQQGARVPFAISDDVASRTKLPQNNAILSAVRQHSRWRWQATRSRRPTCAGNRPSRKTETRTRCTQYYTRK